ncbi:unnamed protein product [Urochloa humidicola]
MDHAATTASSSTNKSSSSSSAAAAPDRALLAAIDFAVERCTTAGADNDDRHVHEILFLVSNAPGAITFLSRRITARLEAARAPAAALRSLLLVHRLLRAGDRYFEQDLRSLWSSGDLRVHSPRCSCSSISTGAACAFVHGYSAYLDERMLWVINQAGNLEPAPRRPAPPPPAATSGGDGDGEALVVKLGMCQRLLDLAMQLLPDNNTSGCGAARSAFGIALRESFKVYAAFADGLDAMASVTLAGMSKPARVSAHEIIKKACAQTPDLREFYHKCKGSGGGGSASSNYYKSLEYPVVRVVTPAAMEMEVLTVPIIPEEEEEGGKEEGEAVTEAVGTSGDGGGGSTAFAARKMETTISEVWVEFEEDDKLIPGDGHSLKEPKAS